MTVPPESRARADELVALLGAGGARRERQSCRGLGIEILGAEQVPEILTAIPHAPRLLWCQTPQASGRLEFGPMVAVVGSRRATALARREAHRLGHDLAAAGVGVVSGLARGVDAAALEGALSGGGLAVAFLGNGLPTIYPPENHDLALRIREAGGAILTEYPLGTPPRRHHFPRRNRLILGLLVTDGFEPGDRRASGFCGYRIWHRFEDVRVLGY